MLPLCALQSGFALTSTNIQYTNETQQPQNGCYICRKERSVTLVATSKVIFLIGNEPCFMPSTAKYRKNYFRHPIICLLMYNTSAIWVSINICNIKSIEMTFCEGQFTLSISTYDISLKFANMCEEYHLTQ